jgi:hypothetical protein
MNKSPKIEHEQDQLVLVGVTSGESAGCSAVGETGLTVVETA